MWIAKPVAALTPAERAAWSGMLAAPAAGRDSDAPLSQTLGWAGAIQAVGGRAYLVFSPEEKAGGLLFSSLDAATGKHAFECVNGPLIRWDEPQAAARQLATFAVAASKLSRDFGSLSLRPRWIADRPGGGTERRLKGLPVEPRSISHAATIQVLILRTQEELLAGFSARLRRSLAQTEKDLLQTEWKLASPSDLEDFVQKMREFSQKKGFSTPPLDWFRALASARPEPSLWIASADTDPASGPVARAQILIATLHGQAHYLFGHETREEGARSRLSPASCAHWLAMRAAASAGIHTYDLNGYVAEAGPDHPYAGVCRFKEQFRGKIVRYDVPEFVIS